MSKVLVIGASSFTGKHFCEYAKQQGAEVEGYSLRDCEAATDWQLQDNDVDYIANFAALNVVAPSWDYVEDYMLVNAVRQLGIWNSAVNHVKSYLHVSTPEVYGNTVGAVTEDAPYNPSTPYAVSRAAAEMMLKCYHKQYQFRVVFTRACNVYGPGQQLYRLIPKLIACIKKGQRFPLEGGGVSMRSFLHVKDACAAYWKVMTEGTPGEAYNVSTVFQYQIKFLVEVICNKLGVKFEDAVSQVMERPGKDASYLLNDDKIRALGWRETISLEQGLKETIEWVETNWDILKDQSMEYVHKP